MIFKRQTLLATIWSNILLVNSNVNAFTPGAQLPKHLTKSKVTALNAIGLGPKSEEEESTEVAAEVVEVVEEIPEPDHELFRTSRLTEFDASCDEWFQNILGDDSAESFLGKVSADAASVLNTPVELKRPHKPEKGDDDWTPYQTNYLPGSPVLPAYGLEKFGLPIPRRNAEVWRHFDVNGLISTDYSGIPEGMGTDITLEDDVQKKYVDVLKKNGAWVDDEDCAGRLVYVNGRFAPSLSFETDICKNMGKDDFESADEDLVEKMSRLPDGFTDRLAGDVPSGETDFLTSFKDLSGPDHNVGDPTRQFAVNGQQGTACFVALNSVKAGAVAYINVPESQSSEKPVMVVNAVTANGGLTEAVEGNKGVSSHPRSLVVAGDNSNLSFIQSFVDLDETNSDDSVQKFVNSCTQMYVGSSANVRHSYLEESGGMVVGKVEQDASADEEAEESPKEAESNRKELRNSFFEAVDVHITGDDGSYEGAFLTIGGNGRSRVSVSTSLLRPGAHAGVSGFSLSGGAQRTDFRTLIHHIAQRTTSRQNQKNMVGGRATTAFRGRIRVEQSAQQTESEQLARTILLSDKSTIWAIPSLEIIADDVTCTHGATVSDLAEEELFYLRSRGIDRTTARNLMMYAFANDVTTCIDDAVQGITDDPDNLQNRIIAKLQNLVPQGERAIKGDFQSV